MDSLVCAILNVNMVRITEELVRKKSEHNECIIGTLEELSLHQEDIEKIEYLHDWCKDLQILLLQSNLISKIENLNKLKKLQYLNLAINNIERIENLEKCESLEKLDLTLNFIGDLESVCSLQGNIHLKHLYLTGNPCADFQNYRDYVVAKLPQIETLDNKDITRSQQIKAMQILGQTEIQIRKAQKKYFRFREAQKERLSKTTTADLDDEEFWKSTSEHAPETRIDIAMRSRRSRKSDKKEKEEVEEKPLVKLFAKDGRPLNVNQAKVKFRFDDSTPGFYILDVAVYKYLDTNLIDVDLQPIVVKIAIKEKVFQLVLPQEISTDKSTAQRSQTTGHLVVRMPIAGYNRPVLRKPEKDETEQPIMKEKKGPNFLEVSDGKPTPVDFCHIVQNSEQYSVDTLEVPPLEFG